MNQWESLARSLHYNTEQEMWTNLYLNKNLSIANLSARFACAPHTIRMRLKKAGVTMRPRGGENNIKYEVTPELEAEIDRDGVAAVAERLHVTVQALYRRVYYKRGRHRRSTAVQEASPETALSPSECPPEKSRQ